MARAHPPIIGLNPELTAFIEQLIDEEDLRLRLYRCPAGKWTIGIGRNIEDNGIRWSEALFMVQNDVNEALADLQTFPWFKALDPVRAWTLVSVRFNLGPARFRGFKRMLLALADGNHASAADELQDSDWFRQVGQRGPKLVARLRTGA
jgi:lysozyme